MRPQDPFIGRDILNGQFQILQKIGSGGMGAVHLLHLDDRPSSQRIEQRGVRGVSRRKGVRKAG